MSRKKVSGTMLSIERHKAKRAKASDGPVYEDSDRIPAILLGELKASFKRLRAAATAVEEHNQRAAALQSEATSSHAVHEHYMDRVKARLKLNDGDMLDLDRGIVRRLVVDHSSRESS